MLKSVATDSSQSRSGTGLYVLLIAPRVWLDRNFQIVQLGLYFRQLQCRKVLIFYLLILLYNR